MKSQLFKIPRASLVFSLMVLMLFVFGCGAVAEPVVVEKEVINEVVKEAPVAKEVVKEVPVVKEVIKEVIVEKEVMIEVAVEQGDAFTVSQELMTSERMPVLPPPEECDPDKPTLQPLKDLDGEQITSPYLGKEGYTKQLTFYNEKNQKFQIVISGATKEPVETFIATSEFCGEGLLDPNPPPETVDSVDPARILIDITADVTGKTRPELSLMRDDLSIDNPASLRDVIKSTSTDPAKVRDEAAAALEAAILKAKNAGFLTELEADVNEIELIQRLLAQEYAPFLTDPMHHPTKTEEHAQRLLDGPDSTLIISALPDFGEAESRTFVRTFFDPEINAYGYHYYIARCANSIELFVIAKRGSMSVDAWKYWAYSDLGSRYAHSVYYPRSSTHLDSSATFITYDAGVKSYSAGGSYDIALGWHQGKINNTC